MTASRRATAAHLGNPCFTSLLWRIFFFFSSSVNHSFTHHSFLLFGVFVSFSSKANNEQTAPQINTTRNSMDAAKSRMSIFRLHQTANLVLQHISVSFIARL